MGGVEEISCPRFKSTIFYCLLYSTANVREKVGKKEKRGQRKDLAEQNPKLQLREQN